MGWASPWSGAWAGPWTGGDDAPAVAPPDDVGGWSGAWGGAWTGTWGSAGAPTTSASIVTISESGTVRQASYRHPFREDDMPLPLIRHMHQTQGETIPIGWDFSDSVDGGAFSLVHTEYGTISLVGVGNRVELAIDNTRAATAFGTYAYTLTANPGVVGDEQIAVRGRWYVEP